MILDNEKACEQAFEQAVLQTRNFVHTVNVRDVVLGVSGGIDSAVVAAIAVAAFGNTHVHGVLMPGPYSSAGSVDDAVGLCENLGVSYITMQIKDAYEACANEYERATGTKLTGLASQNTQARLRMVNLMALSNDKGWMVLNTGNKTEACVGYSTLYGDTCGAFAPIGDLFKTDVFRLAVWINEHPDKCVADGKKLNCECAPTAALIPLEIINKPPSAELATSQTDEESLGASYAALDYVLRGIVETRLYDHEILKNAQLAGIADDLNLSIELIDKIFDMYTGAAFKRALEPPVAMM